MAKQLVPNVASFSHLFDGVVGGLLEGLKAQYTFYVRNTALGWDAAHLQQTANKFIAEFDATGQPVLSTAWQLSAIRAVDEGADPGVTQVVGASLIGERVGQPAPPSVTVLGQVRGDFGGVPPSGSIHLPFGIETDFEGERWSPSLIAPVITYVEAIGPRIGNNPPLGDAVVLVSRYVGTEPDPAAVRAVRRAQGLSNTLRAIFVRSIVGSQRNRRT